MPLGIDPLYAFYGCAAVAAVLVAEAVYLLFHNARSYRSRVNRRLEMAEKEPDREKVLVLLRRERGLSAEGGYLFRLASFNQLIIQSGLKFNLARALVWVAASGAATFAGIFYFRADLVQAAAGGALAAFVLPLMLLLYKRKRRQHHFASQFPGAIDIIVRSLRAGHPVPVAISMVARELPDPVGSEFGMVADEISYGSDLESAMRNMMRRVGQEDLPLFVTSVAIQATTGGNLAQILDNLSKVIRERFQMRRKIKGLSAEGRTGAWILNITPLAVLMIVNTIAPDFYGDIWPHPWTKIVLGCAAGWMVIGNLIMRRMINFKI